MPFSIGQILDILALVVLVMFIPIGLWRGVLREWVALVGITLGSMLAAEWAVPWGGDLAAQTGWRQPMAAFVVGIAFFLGLTLIVGYGGGAAMPFRADLTWGNRLLGALLGVCNGVLVLSGTLRLMQQHLFEGRDDSLLLSTTLSRFLIDNVGWVQLVLMATLVLCVLVSVLRRWSGGLPLMEEFSPGYLVTYQTRDALPEEDWRAGYADEVWAEEPAREVNGPAVAAARQDTTILQLVPPSQVARVESAPPPPEQAPPQRVPNVAPVSSPRANALVSVPRVVDIARPQRAAQTPPPAPAPATPAPTNGQGMVPGETAGRDEITDRIPVTPPAALGLTCPVCQNTLVARARFCDHCGHIIGEAERRRVARQD